MPKRKSTRATATKDNRLSSFWQTASPKRQSKSRFTETSKLASVAKNTHKRKARPPTPKAKSAKRARKEELSTAVATPKLFRNETEENDKEEEKNKDFTKRLEAIEKYIKKQNKKDSDSFDTEVAIDNLNQDIVSIRASLKALSRDYLSAVSLSKETSKKLTKTSKELHDKLNNDNVNEMDDAMIKNEMQRLSKSHKAEVAATLEPMWSALDKICQTQNQLESTLASLGKKTGNLNTVVDELWLDSEERAQKLSALEVRVGALESASSSHGSSDHNHQRLQLRLEKTNDDLLRLRNEMLSSKGGLMWQTKK